MSYECVPHNLPPELLGRIFQLHAAACREPWLPGNEQRLCWASSGPYDWVRATHVCRYWRDVALQSPLLWNHILLTRSVECTKVFLTRSQQIPLIVTQVKSRGCLGERVMPMTPVRMVLAEMHRIYSLELYMKWWAFDDVADMLCTPAPLLKQVKMSTPNGLYDCSIRQSILQLKQCETATLEELTLCAYGFPWSRPAPFRALKTLHVQRGVLDKPSVDEVVRALRVMPDLVSLSLLDVFAPSPMGTSSTLPVHDMATLPHLQRLELSGDIIACSTLLASLVIPETAQISLDYYRKSRISDLPLAASSICGKLPAAYAAAGNNPASPERPIIMRFEHEVSSYRLTCYTIHPQSQVETPTLSIRVALDPDALTSLCRGLPMHGQKNIQVGDAANIGDDIPYLSSIPVY